MATHSPMNISNAERSDSWRESFDPELRGREPRPKAMLLGLPCARCNAYYAAELAVCPICGGKERVSVAASSAGMLVM